MLICQHANEGQINLVGAGLYCQRGGPFQLGFTGGGIIKEEPARSTNPTGKFPGGPLGGRVFLNDTD